MVGGENPNESDRYPLGDGWRGALRSDHYPGAVRGRDWRAVVCDWWNVCTATVTYARTTDGDWLEGVQIERFRVMTLIGPYPRTTR